jgi:hypothetical protein
MTVMFDQRINEASLVGTWLGSLITLLGLLAVFTQLRTLLKTFSIIEMNEYESGSGA